MNLLRLASQAVQALGKKERESGDGSAARSEAEEAGDQAKVFQDSINDFIATMRRVDEGMESQIQGLAGEGIVSLHSDGANAAGATDAQGPSAHQIRLEPDGDGKIGGLDPGWLNSRSNTVERNMEAELWDQADEFLRGLLEKQVSLHVDADVGGNSKS